MRFWRFACAEGRALLTLNRKHFIRLHGANPKHFGIIVCTFDPDFVGQAHRIHGGNRGADSAFRAACSRQSSCVVKK
jgi:hypothetical protein